MEAPTKSLLCKLWQSFPTFTYLTLSLSLSLILSSIRSCNLPAHIISHDFARHGAQKVLKQGLPLKISNKREGVFFVRSWNPFLSACRHPFFGEIPFIGCNYFLIHCGNPSQQPVSVSWDGVKVVLIAHKSSDGQMPP